MVNVKKFLPDLDCVTLPSELFLVAELAKHTWEHIGEQLDVTGVKFSEHLKGGYFYSYFYFVVKYGFLKGVDEVFLDKTYLKKSQFDLVTPVLVFQSQDVARVELESVTHSILKKMYPKKLYAGFTFLNKTDVIFSLSGCREYDALVYSKYLTKQNSQLSHILLDVVAYWLCRRVQDGEDYRLFFDLSKNVFEKWVAVDLVVLKKYTELLDWVGYYYGSTEVEYDAEYQAWWYRYESLGLRDSSASPNKKYKFFITREKQGGLGMQVGDVVVVYKRRVVNVNTLLHDIEYAQPGVIKQINASGFTVEFLCNRDTKRGYAYKYEKALSAQPELYQYGDNSGKKRVFTQKFSWGEIGVDYLLGNEEYLVTPLQGDDTGVLCVEEDGELCFIEIPEYEYLYWLFCEYHLDGFKKQRYAKRYFGDRYYSPLYTQYKKGYNISNFRVEGQNE